MTSVGQGLNIILQGNCMDISTQNDLVATRSHVQKVGLAPRLGTSIFDRVLQARTGVIFVQTSEGHKFMGLATNCAYGSLLDSSL
jgi:hypothetical protein